MGAASDNDVCIIVVSMVASNTLHNHIWGAPQDGWNLVSFDRWKEFCSLARTTSLIVSNVIFDVVGLSPWCFPHGCGYMPGVSSLFDNVDMQKEAKCALISPRAIPWMPIWLAENIWFTHTPPLKFGLTIGGWVHPKPSARKDTHPSIVLA